MIRNNFKVTIAVGGAWHAFYLAEQLHQSGHLDKIITSFFKWKLKNYQVPSNKIISLSFKMWIEGIWRRLPLLIKNKYNPEAFTFFLFDFFASRAIRSGDICLVWAGIGLRTLRQAKKQGSVTIVERGNAHILCQKEILEEEYKRFHLPFNFTHDSIVERELKEYEEADYISVPSMFAKKSFLQRGFKSDKIIHVPYGVNLSEFKTGLKNDQVFRIIYVGRINIRKGVYYLLKAYKELNLPHSELLLIGGVDDEMKIILSEFSGIYKWMDYMPQRELVNYYSQSSVFVTMSLEEGLALVQLQAMACGLPVICTTNTGGEDVIEDGINGFVIPTRSESKLKEKLLFLHKNPNLCQKMGVLAQAKINQGYSWDDYGERINLAYSRILE